MLGVDAYIEFARSVQDCLDHLHDLAFLEAHPLAGLLDGSGQAVTGEALRRVLVEAIDRLRPVGGTANLAASVEWRRHRYLRLHYEEGLTLHQAARSLDISPRQASRDQQQGVDTVARLLWVRRSRLRPGSPQTLESSALLDNDPSTGGTARPAFEDEVSQLARIEDQTSADVEQTVRGVIATIASLASERGISLEAAPLDTVSPVLVSRTALRQTLFSLLSYVVELPGVDQVWISAADTARGVELSLDVRRWKGRPDRPLTHARGVSAAGDLLEAGRRLLESQAGAVEVHHHPDGELTIELLIPPVPSRQVLVIDDNPDVVALFRRFLRRRNYRLVHAATAASALRLASELRPDVITLDLLMPTQDGWEILQQLRQFDVTRQTPILVCSVLPEKALAFSLGATDLLTKPVTRAGLLSSLERCLAPVAPVRPGSP
jgi:CheY-like chemotaxis protein